MSAQLIKRVNQYHDGWYIFLTIFGAFASIGIAENILAYFGL